MTINDFNTIINMIIKLGLTTTFIIISFKLYKFATTKYIEIKNKKIENEKTQLYANINTELVREELNKLIRVYVSRYITKNIMVNQITFIKNDQADQMVKDIVKEVTLDMSDLYITYCKLLCAIDNEKDIVKLVLRLTTDIVLESITKYNELLK